MNVKSGRIDSPSGSKKSAPNIRGGTPRLIDVAQDVGVAVSTVSRVLRNRPARVRPETRLRILESANQLGYRANAQGRSLRTQRTETIALIVPDMDNIGFTAVTRGVQEMAAELGYLVVLVDGRAFPWGKDLRARLVQERRVDGLLVAFAQIDDEFVRELAASDTPLIVVNRRTHGVDASVVVDDEAGSRLAIEHLIRLGHSRIGYVAGTSGTDTAQRRERGVRHALAAAGLSLESGWTEEGCFTLDGGRTAMRQIIDRSRSSLPTAIYAANLMSALGAMEAIADAQLSIPADISLVAMDDHVIASLTRPALTTVAMPVLEMGAEAMRALHRLIQGEQVGEIVIAERPRVVERASTAAPPPP